MDKQKETIMEYKVPVMYQHSVDRWGELKQEKMIPETDKKKLEADPNAKKKQISEVGMGWKDGTDFKITKATDEARKKGQYWFTVQIMNPKMLSIKAIRDLCVYGQRDVTKMEAEIKGAEQQKAKQQKLNEGEAQ